MLRKFVKKVLNWDRKKFDRICQESKIKLDFELNKEAIRVLETVFVEEEYRLAFPFNKKATVIDVGGHFGYFSLYANRNLQDGSTVITCEPSTQNISILKENFKKNNLDFNNVFEVGLGEKTESVKLYGGSSYNHSVVPNGSEVLGEIQLYRLEELLSKCKLEKVDFLKLDCEGSEYEILLNADVSSLKKIDTISLEFHDRRSDGLEANQLIDRLKESGFEILKFEYDHDYSGQGLKFGKIVASKKLSSQHFINGC